MRGIETDVQPGVKKNWSAEELVLVCPWQIPPHFHIQSPDGVFQIKVNATLPDDLSASAPFAGEAAPSFGLWPMPPV